MFELTDISPKYLIELFEMLQKRNLPLVDIFIYTPDSPSGRYIVPLGSCHYCHSLTRPILNLWRAHVCEIIQQRNKETGSC